MRKYNVCYKMYGCDETHDVTVSADNTQEAYVKATYGEIPATEGTLPYSSWVESVTYANGKHHSFPRNMEGHAY